MPNPSIAPSEKFGAVLGQPNNVYIQTVSIGDYQGNLIRTSDAGVGDGTSFLGGAVTLVALPSAAYTAASPIVFSTAGITYLAVDTTITAFAGGSAPTIQFLVDRLSADGNYYNIWADQVKGNSGLPASETFDLGPGFVTSAAPNGSQHAVFTGTARFRWLITGSPTSVTFSASVIGK